MNTQEFKAWFEGFTESMNGPPTKKAWARIKERVAEIQPGVSTTYPVFVDRYWHYGPPYYAYGSVAGSVTNTLAGSNSQECSNATISFNASDAFTALGRADASSIQ